MCWCSMWILTVPVLWTYSQERAAFRWNCCRAVSVEQDRDHHRFIQECIHKLTAKSQEPNAQIIPIRGDVFRFLKSCKQQYDLIFADPPYALKELDTLPDIIFEKQLLKEDGIFVLEHGKDHDFSGHPHFKEHRQYGSVNFSIFTTTATPCE